MKQSSSLWSEYVAIKEAQFIKKAREDILAFTLRTKSDYFVGWHHRMLAKKLNAWARGEIRFLMVFMPPRHGKSELVSRRLPAFLHGLYPDAEIMAASYLDSLAGDMTIGVQNIIDSVEYKEIFPDTKIWPPGTSYTKGTRNSTEHHIVGRRGKYRGQGVGGSFTGKGANFIIVDDPIKSREIADSETFRERLWDFYNNDLFSRLETNLESGRPGQVLITQTRWHEDDLSGRLIDLMRHDPNAAQFDIVEFPAIKIDNDNPDDTRPGGVGAALWPEKYSIAELNKMRATIGERAWSSLYQQRPVAAGGNLFKEEMFLFCDLPKNFQYKFITADTSYKEKQENDFTVFSCWGVLDGQLYLIDYWREQIKAADVEHKAENFIKKHVTYGFRWTLIEPKGHGIYLNQKFQRLGLHVPSDSELKEFFSDRRFDKVERANNAIPYLTHSKLHINKMLSGKEDLVSEALMFPKGKHDDWVDTLVDAVKKVYSPSVSILDVL